MKENHGLRPDTVQRVREMYRHDRAARSFFERAAERINDVAETKLERIAQMADIDYRQARDLADELEKAGCGKFKVGRKGYETRFVWDVSLPSLGKVAKGQQEKLSAIDPEVKEDSGRHALSVRHLTIPQAKRLLAESLGIDEDKIEITIRG